MFVRITADSTPRPNSLRDLGMTSDSNALVSLSEFSYRKGTEIYGEKEPAKYVYQVKAGDYLGQNYGKITKISETDVSLREIVQDAAGEWIERTSSLQLQEKAR